MRRTTLQLIVAALGLAFWVSPAAAELPAPEKVKVGPGTWRPLYPADGEEEVHVDAFLLDDRAVTNGEFLEFVRENAKWRRDRIPSLFAEETYLSHWEGPTELGDAVSPDQPATFVSWWAARAFCEARGDRLPLQREWELAAMASETDYDATHDPEFLARILSWYARPGNAELPVAGSGPANKWGVHDLHGAIWEWVEDFHAALIVVDNRADGKVDTSLFCGAGAVAAPDKGDYAAFMRLGFRSSLEGDYATRNLGFRCARDLGQGETK